MHALIRSLPHAGTHSRTHMPKWISSSTNGVSRGIDIRDDSFLFESDVVYRILPYRASLGVEVEHSSLLLYPSRLPRVSLSRTCAAFLFPFLLFFFLFHLFLFRVVSSSAFYAVSRTYASHILRTVRIY